MKEKCFSVMKALPLWVGCLFFVFGFRAAAQTRLVSSEYHGAWTLDHARVQERALNSNDAFVARDLAKTDLMNESQFADIPVGIRIDGLTDVTTVETAAGEQHEAWAAINTADNSLQFLNREAEQATSGEFVTTPTSLPAFFNPTLDGEGRMTMQRPYIYRNAQGEYRQGDITLYYNRLIDK